MGLMIISWLSGIFYVLVVLKVIIWEWDVVLQLEVWWPTLDITGIDPVAKNLIFERFLNRERYTMPDIDIDIPDIYRPEFIRYVRDRYGSNPCCADCHLFDLWSQAGHPRYFQTLWCPRV